MAKTLACGDLMPGCDFKAEAETEEELLQKAAAHAAEAHGITEVNEELLAKVRGAIRDS